MFDWLLLFALGTQGDYDIVAVNESTPRPHLQRTEYVVQAGASPLNRFAVTHVSKQHGHARRAPIVLLSPFSLPGEFYEVSDTDDYGDSLAGRLARTNRDVWLVDQRRSGLLPGECEAQVEDCSVMLDWNFDTYVADALFASTLARIWSFGRRPVIGGFSAGSNAAMAAINEAPDWFSGVMLYEGTFYSEQQDIIDHNEPVCELLDEALALGQSYDPSFAVLGAVIQLAALDPEGLSPLGVFPPGTTNQQALLYVFSAPPPPGALSPTPNFVRMIADFATEEFVYSSQARLEQVGPMFDSYASLAALRDLACGLAGEDTTHYDNLDQFEGDVLMFVGGTGFGESMFDTAELFTGARSVTIDHHPELGEADFYFHQEWEDVLYRPLKRWLRR